MTRRVRRCLIWLPHPDSSSQVKVTKKNSHLNVTDPDRFWIEWRYERYLHTTTIIMIENNLHAWFILKYRDGTFHCILAPLYIPIRNSAGVNQSDQQPYKLVGKMWTSVSVMGYWVYRCGIVNSWRGTFRIPLFHNKIKLIDFAIRSQFFDCMIK